MEKDRNELLAEIKQLKESNEFLTASNVTYQVDNEVLRTERFNSDVEMRRAKRKLSQLEFKDKGGENAFLFSENSGDDLEEWYIINNVPHTKNTFKLMIDGVEREGITFTPLEKI